MTPKELVQKGYDSFAVGDMATIKSLFHEQAVIKVNGMHKFSGTYHGPDSFINDFLAHIPSHFENFKVEPNLMVAEGEYVFALVRELRKVWKVILVIFTKLKMGKQLNSIFWTIHKN